MRSMEMAAFSASLSPNRWLSSSSTTVHPCLQFSRIQKFLALRQVQNRKKTIISALNNLKSSIGNNDSGATDPARILLERLFAQTQRLEERMSKYSSPSGDVELTINLEILGSDLNAALSALKKKEDDLQVAERKLVLDQAELNRAKHDLVRREKEIAIIHAKQKEMEEALKEENDNLASKAYQIEDLKHLIEEQDRKIFHLQSALSLKEDQLDKLRNEMVLKTEEVTKMSAELEHKSRLLDEANEIIEKQKAEIKELQIEMREKEDEIAKSVHLKKVEEKLNIAEANLEKQVVEWLAIKKELKKLADQVSKNMTDVEETSDDFKRVTALLSDVKSELIAAQESLALSHSKLEDQAIQLEKQLEELNEQKLMVTAYAKGLKDAQLEVEVERTKFKYVQAQRKELEFQLFTERELTERLKGELAKEGASLEEATGKIDSLQKELHLKELEFCDTQNLLQVKERELAEARVEIHHLTSEQASLQLILEEKDRDLLHAQKILAAVYHRVLELKNLLRSKEDQLIQSSGKLQEKEDSMLAMQCELDNAKLKFSEASTMIERIVELTSKLVIPDRDEHAILDSKRLGAVGLLIPEKEDASVGDWRSLETDLEMTEALLRTRELELHAIQRALTVKDEELKTVLKQWDMRERKMEKMKDELSNDSNGLKKLYALAQETSGDKNVEGLRIEKLQLETAKAEIEAAMGALRKLVDMSNQLLQQSESCKSFDMDSTVLGKKNTQTGNASILRAKGSKNGLSHAEREVAHLLALTEKLVKDAGFSSRTDL